MKKYLCLILIVFFATSCDSENVLREYHSTDKDEALLYDAKAFLDRSEWDQSIDILTNQVSVPFRENRRVKEVLMHAYGGKCGIRFFDLVNQLKNVNTTNVFRFVLPLFAGKSIDREACEDSYGVLMSLGTTATERLSNENFYAAILGLTKISTTLKAKYDTDNSGLGNGVIDAGIDGTTASCSPAPFPPVGPTYQFTEGEMDDVAIGMGLVLENLTVLDGELGSGSAGGALGDVNTICAQATSALNSIVIPPPFTLADLNLAPDALDPIQCIVTQKSDVTAKYRRLLRRMLASTDMGFGGCDVSVISVDPGSPPGVNPRVVSDCCPAEVFP